jgi:hypothetical protein
MQIHSRWVLSFGVAAIFSVPATLSNAEETCKSPNMSGQFKGQ